MGQLPKFDKLSFVKYMKNIGRAYRKQATELVFLCRTFVQAQEQTPGSDAKLRSALELVDAALESATKAETKTSKTVDEKFEKAINALSNYETDCHRRKPALDGSRANTVRERMDAAKGKDKSSSTTLNALKEKSRTKSTPDEWSEPTKVVDFLVLKSLPDEAPVVVQQVLGKGSNIAEILWNFNRCKGEKRITLKQNPHFYRGLPRKKEEYGGYFRSDPMESFLDTPEVYVLTDKPGRVYLESGQDARAFGNVWIPNDAIIFKDVCGKLEGESIVGSSVQGNPELLRYRVEPLRPSTSTSSIPWESLQDWREPIHRALKLKSENTSIHISAELPKSAKSLRVSSFSSSNSTLGWSNTTKQPTSSTPLSSSTSTRSLLALAARVSSHGTSRSVSSQPSLTTSPTTDSTTLEPVPSHRTSQSTSTSPSTDPSRLEPVHGHRTSQPASPTQPTPTTSLSTDSAMPGPVPNYGTSRSPSPSQLSLTTLSSTDSTTLEPVPSHGISQYTSPSQPLLTTLPSTDSATSELVPSTVSTPLSATRRQEETPNISQKSELKGSVSLLSVSVTTQSVKTSPPINPPEGRDARSDGNVLVQAKVAGLTLEAATIMPLKSDSKPPPSQAHGKQPAQRPGSWQFWFQGSVWRR